MTKKNEKGDHNDKRFKIKTSQKSEMYKERFEKRKEK